MFYSVYPQAVDTDALLFHDDDVISIDPIDGEIWPNSQAEITVKFQPREAVTYVRTVYLDVTGREERLPLKIRGDGMGPITQLSFDTLDVGNLFVNSTHSYEVSSRNEKSEKFCVARSISGTRLTDWWTHRVTDRLTDKPRDK